jgi:hypothetical protein
VYVRNFKKVLEGHVACKTVNKQHLLNNPHLHTGLSSSLFPTGFLLNFYAFLISLMYAACPYLLILVDFVTLIIFNEESKL